MSVGAHGLMQLMLLRLRLHKSAETRFFHGPTDYAFLHERLGTYQSGQSFSSGLRFLSCETGRVRYERGEFYHIALARLPGAPLSVAQLAERLSARASARRRGTGMPLDHRVTLAELRDLGTGKALQTAQDASWLTLAHARDAAARLAQERQVQIRLDSPLLILRTPVSKRDTFFDERVFLPDVFLQRVARAISDVFPELTPATVPESQLVDNALVRAETHYHGNSGVKVLLGSCGSVTLEFAEPVGQAWALALLLAGVIGTGKGTDMGQGRFSVVGHPLSPRWPPPAASTIVERMVRSSTLALARDGILRGGEAPGVDDVERGEFLDSLSYREPLLVDALLEGSYKPSALRGLLFSKPDGGVRPMAIPTLHERFLQRACVEELASAFDELLEESSFAYRRGLSRRNAEYSVRQAHADGYTHVLDADLYSFFDEVDWHLLERRLRAYLGDDPVVALLMKWVRAPVEFDDELIERRGGLPQGAVVSPLLANLYLDPFDEAIAAKGFRLVRYADDFVVLCKTEQELEQARTAVEEELSRLRLELAEGKTSKTSFDAGFEFLGYLFCKSLVLETNKRARQEKGGTLASKEALRQLPAAQARGWLLDLLGRVDESPPERPPHWRTPLVPRAPERRSVYVVEPGLKISGGRRGLRVYRGDRLIAEHAWSVLSEVVVVGGHYVTPSAINHAMRQRVPIAYYSRAARPLGLVLPERVRCPSATTRRHWQWHQDTAARMNVARQLIHAKIRNQRLLARYQRGDNDTLRQRLLQLGRQALRVEVPERLRGVEGQAAYAYFSSWPSWLPPDLAFENRSGRGAHDPVNAVLNLLYTQLFRQCWLALLSHGLDAYLGVLHEANDRYPALAADLQEPFRFLCERLTLELFHRGSLTRGDFHVAGKGAGPLLLKHAALKKVLVEWEKRLQAHVNSNGKTQSYQQHILAQAQRLTDVVVGATSDIQAFTLKW